MLDDQYVLTSTDFAICGGLRLPQDLFANSEVLKFRKIEILIERLLRGAPEVGQTAISQI